MNRYVLTFPDQSCKAYALADELTDSIKRGLFVLVERDAEVYREKDEGDVHVFFSSDLTFEDVKQSLSQELGSWHSPIRNWSIDSCTSEHDQAKAKFVRY